MAELGIVRRHSGNEKSIQFNGEGGSLGRIEEQEKVRQAIKTKGLPNKRMVCPPEGEQGRAELFMRSEGHGRCEDPGRAAPKNSPA